MAELELLEELFKYIYGFRKPMNNYALPISIWWGLGEKFVHPVVSKIQDIVWTYGCISPVARHITVIYNIR